MHVHPASGSEFPAVAVAVAVVRPPARPTGDAHAGPSAVSGAANAELQVAEADYRYGTGTLRMRVERIDRSGEVELDGDVWLPVHGIRLRSNGTEVGEVQVFVRAAVLRSHT